jgi:uncharacterized membrane protein
LNEPSEKTFIGTVPERSLPAEAYRRMTMVLRTGLVASLLVLGGGLVVYLAERSSRSASAVISSNPILQYLTLPGLASGLLAGSVEAYLTLGLLILVATPIVRVVSGFYYFRRGGERAMSAITFGVIVLILVGLLVLGPLVR